MCVLLFSITFLETVFMLRRTERDMIRNVFMSVLLFKFLLNLNCFYRFTKKYSNIIFSEIPPSGSRVPCRRTDRRTNIPTDMTKLMVVFSNFTKVPKNRYVQHTFQWSFASGFQTKTCTTLSLLSRVLHPNKGKD